MYRHRALQVSALILTVFLVVAPAVAAPTAASPSTFERIIMKIKKIFLPVVTEDPSFPHP